MKERRCHQGHQPKRPQLTHSGCSVQGVELNHRLRPEDSCVGRSAEVGTHCAATTAEGKGGMGFMRDCPKMRLTRGNSMNPNTPPSKAYCARTCHHSTSSPGTGCRQGRRGAHAVRTDNLIQGVPTAGLWERLGPTVSGMGGRLCDGCIDWLTLCCRRMELR